ncbi:unnamed protein product [Prorocentrum cordatum]|uniref:PX domain-containing protein n=1 Tax=Prorocentrum cordatum TaxID=2364126 RepID=A0ABN9UZD6_9DINO|nr:unnamed protein product [Polarella glacialis]
MQALLGISDPGREALLQEFGGECDKIARTRALLAVAQQGLGVEGACHAGEHLSTAKERLGRCAKSCDSVEGVLSDWGLRERLRQAKERWEPLVQENFQREARTDVAPDTPPTAAAADASPDAPPTTAGVEAATDTNPTAVAEEAAPDGLPTTAAAEVAPDAPLTAAGAEAAPDVLPTTAAADAAPDTPPTAVGAEAAFDTPPTAAAADVSPDAPLTTARLKAAIGAPPTAGAAEAAPDGLPTTAWAESAPDAPPTAAAVDAAHDTPSMAAAAGAAPDTALTAAGAEAAFDTPPTAAATDASHDAPPTTAGLRATTDTPPTAAVAEAGSDGLPTFAGVEAAPDAPPTAAAADAAPDTPPTAVGAGAAPDSLPTDIVPDLPPTAVGTGAATDATPTAQRTPVSHPLAAREVPKQVDEPGPQREKAKLRDQLFEVYGAGGEALAGEGEVLRLTSAAASEAGGENENRAGLRALIESTFIQNGTTFYRIRLFGSAGPVTYTKRYSDFRAFDETLRERSPALHSAMPQLPEPGVFGLRHKLGASGFEQRRRDGLQAYLDAAAAWLDEATLRGFLELRRGGPRAGPTRAPEPAGAVLWAA